MRVPISETEFDIFTDQDDILDIINSLDPALRKIFFRALDGDHQEGRYEEAVIYAAFEPSKGKRIHIVLMRFSGTDDDGLLLMMADKEESIYQYFNELYNQQKNDYVKEMDKVVRHLITNSKKD